MKPQWLALPKARHLLKKVGAALQFKLGQWLGVTARR
jgi:hypothetical protein